MNKACKNLTTSKVTIKEIGTKFLKLKKERLRKNEDPRSKFGKELLRRSLSLKLKILSM
jgi:hypothetical protein